MLAIAGCSTLRMAPPPDIEAQSDVFDAKNRSNASGLLVDESFELGPYAIAKVDRDWNKARDSSSGFNGLHFSKGEARTSFAFQFREGSASLAAQCTSLTAREGLSLGGSSLRSSVGSLRCTCGSGVAEAKLEIDGRSGMPTGQVTLQRGTFAVSSVEDTNAAMGRTVAGFRVDGAGAPLGAVEVLRPGRIWLSKAIDDDERRQLGCLLAGLMLYEEPSDD